MPENRDLYQLYSTDVESLRSELNSLFDRLSKRLDQYETDLDSLNFAVVEDTIFTTSGANHDFDIPDGAVQVVISYSSVSSSGTNAWLVRLGSAGRIETTGYSGAGSSALGTAIGTTNYTTGFGIRSADGAFVIHGSMIITRVNADTNLWVASYAMAGSDNTRTFWGGGSKSLSDTLDKVRITTVGGTDTYDAGQISCMSIIRQ